jgi:hypothetical protein
MPLPPSASFARTACVLAAIAALAAPLSALAGRAQVGGSLGIYSEWDLSDVLITGRARDDGVQTQSVLVTTEPASSGNVAANRNGQSGVNNARVEIAGQALMLQPGGAGVPVSGERSFAADVDAGQLKLAMRNGYAAYPVYGAGGQLSGQRRAWIQGLGYAEMREGFELRFPKALAGSVVVTLSMRVDGLVSNRADNGLVGGVNALLELGNVETGGITNLLSEERFHETSVAGDTITLSGALRDMSCPATRDWCDSWVVLYAALQLKTRNVATNVINFGSAAASELDFGHTAQLFLSTPADVTLLQIETLDPIHYAWVNAQPVPEPAAALLMLAGLGALVPLARRRRSAATSAA